MPRVLRADCLALAVTELCRAKILTPEGLSFSRTFGPIQLHTFDRLDDQVGANARGFIASGAGLVKATWSGGAVAVNVESRPSKIAGYNPWVLLCPSCHGDKRKLLITPSKTIGCARCLAVRYPDQRRRLSWGSWVKAQDEMWKLHDRILREAGASGRVSAEAAVDHPLTV